MRGIERTGAMLTVMSQSIPRLGVDRARCAAALEGGALVTDEVMRRVEEGLPFRTAYRQVAAELKTGDTFPAPSHAKIIARRSSTGGLGNLGLGQVRARLRRARAWQSRERNRFDRAIRRLAGHALPDRPTDRP